PGATGEGVHQISGSLGARGGMLVSIGAGWESWVGQRSVHDLGKSRNGRITREPSGRARGAVGQSPDQVVEWLVSVGAVSAGRRGIGFRTGISTFAINIHGGDYVVIVSEFYGGRVGVCHRGIGGGADDGVT